MGPPFFTTMSDNLITIEVGSGEDIKRFSIYQELLTTWSKYFKVAFEGEFQEAKEDFLSIPGAKPSQFHLDWLYFGRLSEDLYGADHDRDHDHDENKAPYKCEGCGIECLCMAHYNDPNHKDDWITMSDKPYIEFPTLTQQQERT